MRSIVIGLLALVLPVMAAAETLEERLISEATRRPDLKLPQEAKTLSMFSPLGMAIYKPEKSNGPLPAIILLHTCVGVEQQSRDWTKEALAHGYVVFVLDSLNQRGAKDFCGERGRGSGGLGVKDVFQALEHLKHFDFVDPDRVGLMGFSWGAIIALYASSPAVAKAFSVAKRFPAVVALYPACYIPASNTDILRGDADLPLLVLMGARDTPPFSTDCVSRLETLKARGAPVAWKLYPEATHCWDCTGAQNLQGVDFAGNRRITQYNSTVTQDSRRRAFEFLNNHLKRRPGS